MNLQICTTAGDDLLLRDVSTYMVDNDMIRVLYCNGKQQNYPLANVRWYGPEDPLHAPIKPLGKPFPDCPCQVCEVARAEQHILREMGLE